MAETLRPRPFCGGEAEFEIHEIETCERYREVDS